jgi:hypothetical protein
MLITAKLKSQDAESGQIILVSREMAPVDERCFDCDNGAFIFEDVEVGTHAYFCLNCLASDPDLIQMTVTP